MSGDTSDERVSAWRRIAAHPAFADCYDEERPLLDAMLDRLDELTGAELTGPVDLYVLRAGTDSGAVALALPLTDDEAVATEAVRSLLESRAVGSGIQTHMVSAQEPGRDDWVLDSARPVSRQEVEKAWAKGRDILPPVDMADIRFGK